MTNVMLEIFRPFLFGISPDAPAFKVRVFISDFNV